MTQCQSYWSFMVTSALFGVFHAPYAASVAVAITDLCGISSLATAFGMLQFVYGIGVVLGRNRALKCKILIETIRAFLIHQEC